MVRRSDRKRTFPYYKVHVFNRMTNAWTDARKEGFATLEAARAFIRQLSEADKARILVVDERGRRPLAEDLDPARSPEERT